MKPMKKLKRLSVIFLIIAFSLNTIGCTKRVLVPMDRNSLEKESILYVKLTSGKEVKVKGPRFEDGFLSGKTPVYETRPGPDKEIKINVKKIDSIRVERFNRRKTIVSLTAMVVILGIFFYFISHADLSELK